MPDNEVDPVKSPKPPVLEPRPSITLFDFSHLALTIYASYKAATMTAVGFGWMLGALAFLINAIIAFFLLGFSIAVFVLLLYRVWPRGIIGYEAACYLQTHFRQDASNDERPK